MGLSRRIEMPELPEVENIARQLRRLLVGKTIGRVEIKTKKLRRELDVDSFRELRGHIIIGVQRQAKYLKIITNQKLQLLIHLGMTGKLLYLEEDFPDKHSHLFISFKDIKNKLIFHDVRRFGMFWVTPVNFPLKTGIEPLSEAFTSEFLLDLLQNKTGNIKSFLLNGDYVAGIGNIYALEILFAAGISPLRQIVSLNVEEINSLRSAIQQILTKAIERGGSTIQDYRLPSGSKGSFQQCFRVYQQKTCQTCDSPITACKQGGRSSFFCAHCQK